MLSEKKSADTNTSKFKQLAVSIKGERWIYFSVCLSNFNLLLLSVWQYIFDIIWLLKYQL